MVLSGASQASTEAPSAPYRD